MATQRPASSGWLLDALEENIRRTATAGPGFQSSKADKADAADERKSDPRTGPAAAPGKDPAAAGLDRNGTKNALSAYMSVWLSPEEYRRLQSLYPEQTVGTPEGKEPGAALDPMLRLDRPMTPATTTDALLGGFGDQNRAAKANPFVQSLQAPPRPTPVSVAPVESVRIATPATATQAPVEPAPVRTATPAVPAAPGADDRKYFPQLKRF